MTSTWIPPHGWWDDYPADEQENKEPWVGHPRQAEFERSFAEHERAMAACTCEWDGGYGDDGSQGKRFPRYGCPTHCQEDDDEGVFADDEEETPMKGRWAKTAGGWILEAEVPGNVFYEEPHWAILAFVTPTVRRNGWLLEIGSGMALGVSLGIAACRRQSFATLEEAKAAAEKATAVEIESEEEGK